MVYKDGWEKAEELAAHRAGNPESARQKRIEEINELCGGAVLCPHCGASMGAKAFKEYGDKCLYCEGHIPPATLVY